MTTSYDTDPNTKTIAAAWASSELGQPDREARYGCATSGLTESVTTSEEEATARRVMVASGLACGIAAGVLLGVMLFRLHRLGTTHGRGTRTGSPARCRRRPEPAAPAPKPVVSEQGTAPIVDVPAPRVAPAPDVSPSTTDAATPPHAAAGDTTVVIDIPIPDYPPLPDEAARFSPWRSA